MGVGRASVKPFQVQSSTVRVVDNGPGIGTNARLFWRVESGGGRQPSVFCLSANCTVRAIPGTSPLALALFAALALFFGWRARR